VSLTLGGAVVVDDAGQKQPWSSWDWDKRAPESQGYTTLPMLAVLEEEWKHS